MILYLGVLLMVGSWFEVVRTLRRRPHTPLRSVVPIIFAWTAPVLVMPPLFSRDAYSYAAQGELLSRGIDPYLHGPNALGPNPYDRLVDPIWQSAHAPYGPAWVRLSQALVLLSRHDVIATLVGFRLVALVGLALVAWGVPAIARSLGRDPAPALALAVLNPLVILVLLGGAHNDALMLGLLVMGCAAARRRHFVAGLFLCALAAEVKIPAFIGAMFIGWWWSDGEANWRQRVPKVVGAIALTGLVMVGISLISGLGWRWLDGLANPGVVVSWIDPATAIGLVFHRIFSAFGLGGHEESFVRSARGVGLALAAVVSVGLVFRSNRVGAIQALGWSLLAFVILGPVVWPWYETWGFVFLAVIAEAWTLRLLLALSAIACFADVPSVHFFEVTQPILAVAGWMVLSGATAAYVGFRLVPSAVALFGNGSTSPAEVTNLSEQGAPPYPSSLRR